MRLLRFKPHPSPTFTQFPLKIPKVYTSNILSENLKVLNSKLSGHKDQVKGCGPAPLMTRVGDISLPMTGCLLQDKTCIELKNSQCMNLGPQICKKGAVSSLSVAVSSVPGATSSMWRPESWDWESVRGKYAEVGGNLGSPPHTPCTHSQPRDPSAAQREALQYSVLQGRCAPPGIQKPRPHSEAVASFF